MTTLGHTAATPTMAPPAEWRSLIAVVRRCLRDQRRSPLTWGIPLGLMSALELAIYPSVSKSLDKMMSSYPQALKDAFRMESIDTPAQFLNGEMYSLIIPLAIGFFAIRAATRPIAGYEERRWMDTVLALPVRRRTLLAGGFAAAVISAGLIMLVTIAISWVAGEVAGAGVAVGDFAAAWTATVSFAVFFAALGVLVAGRIGSWAAVTGIAGGTLVAMYVIDVVSRITAALEHLGPISAFHYYGSPLAAGLNAANVTGLVLVGIVLAAIGALLFERRDISG